MPGPWASRQMLSKDMARNSRANCRWRVCFAFDFFKFSGGFLLIKFFFTINAPEPPIIGHLKSGFRLAGIFLKNFIGDYISVLMAAAAKSLAILLAGL